MMVYLGASAQTDESDSRGQFQFGLKTGLNYANVYDSQTEEFTSDPKIGFVGGVLMRIPLGKVIGIQPEVLYSKKGFEGEGILLGSPYSLTRTITFIDIPLQLAIKPAEFLTIVAGPQFSYQLKKKDVITNSNSSTVHEEEFKNENIRKNVLGIVGGVDINLDKFIIGARVAWDIQDNHGDGTSSTPRYKNAWLQGTIGYLF